MNQYVGIYRFSVKDFNTNQIIWSTARCIVLNETNKSYKIKLLTSIQRRISGDTLWVRKSSVVLRSYLIYGTSFCEKYNQQVSEQSCRACLQNCLTKMETCRHGAIG